MNKTRCVNKAHSVNKIRGANDMNTNANGCKPQAQAIHLVKFSQLNVLTRRLIYSNTRLQGYNGYFTLDNKLHCSLEELSSGPDGISNAINSKQIRCKKAVLGVAL